MLQLHHTYLHLYLHNLVGGRTTRVATSTPSLITAVAPLGTHILAGNSAGGWCIVMTGPAYSCTVTKLCQPAVPGRGCCRRCRRRLACRTCTTDTGCGEQVYMCYASLARCLASLLVVWTSVPMASVMAVQQRPCSFEQTCSARGQRRRLRQCQRWSQARRAC